MPIYLYRCRSCEATEEHIQKFSDPPVETCAACGGKLERVIAPSSPHFKGDGWARDGYASPKPKKD